MKSRRIFAFDLIRVLAMAMIVVFHYNMGCANAQVITPPIRFSLC